MIKDNTNRLHLWQGTKKVFNELRRYRTGGLYFVMDGQTAQSSEDGVIYLAIGAHQVVRFGSFSKEDDLDEKLRELAEEIAERLTFEEHETQGGFPAVGDPNTFYVSLTDGRMYRWDGSQYVAFGGYTAGDGIRIENGVISLDGGGRVVTEDELEQAMEQVPVIHVISTTEVERLCDEAWGTTSDR